MRHDQQMSRLQSYDGYGSRIYRHFTDTIWRPLVKSPSRSKALLFSFLAVLLLGALFSTRLLDTTVASKNSAAYPFEKSQLKRKSKKQIEILPNCIAYNVTQTCPSNYPTSFQPEEELDSSCPEYFRWIHEDLRPWAYTGITREMVQRAGKTANFKLVILNGKAYIETIQKSFQTRDVFTIWGILQLLRRYPGKVPDLELMFDCVDWPVILSKAHIGQNATTPPPLFRYCGDDATLDIVFPDWSFWGWPETNIKPWETLLNELKKGNKKKKWMKREPYAYWKGNPVVAETRQDLMKCNVSDNQDWNVRVYAQDWIHESQQGYKQSDLASQCIHRYKIYIEGSAWSVSEKYILACDSVTLFVRPRYYDFYTRGLMPVHHYWPVREDDKCRSIKFAVDWGNSHKKKAQAIGKAASDFIQEELRMEYVYDYMFHLLSAYAKLLRFKPSVSSKAVELCAEAMICGATGIEKKLMMESIVKSPANKNPCTMPPPYDPPSFHALLRRKEDSIRQVELWEKFFWDNHPTQT